MWIADAHRGDGKRFIVRADEMLSAFVELESAVQLEVMNMKTRQSHRQTAKVSHCRWLAYASASAATALVGSNSAEAAIHYFNPLDSIFRPGELKEQFLRLHQGSTSYNLFAFEHAPAGFAGFNFISYNCSPNYCAGFRGRSYFVSKLSFGQNISAGTFTRRSASYFGEMITTSGLGQWGAPGVGFIGFKFQGSVGIQYGWVWVKMAGSDRNNGFKVLDYAFADAGEPIFAGQRSSDEQAPDQGSTDEQATDEGSLGGLALGALGLLAWRKSRSRTARSPQVVNNP